MAATRWCTYLLGVVVAAVALCVLAAPVTPARAEAALTVIEDAYVDESIPLSNFGTATRLKTDGSPRVTIYLKFDVSGLPTPPSAALRVFTANDADTSFEVRTVADTSWSESTITAANAPSVGEVVAASGPVRANTWQTIDVSSSLAGDGVITLALTTASPRATTIHSREDTNVPQLVIPAPPSPSPFVIHQPAAGSSSYVAESASTGRSYAGTLKSVVESAAVDLSRAGGGIVHFNAGVYDLGDSQFELRDLVGVTFEGEGMDDTTIANSRSVSADTEVFDVARATGGGIRDLTVSAGGPARSTSDAVDFDAGRRQVIERVKVIRSRSRGIVFDGKDVMGGIARGAQYNVVRNCVVTNVPGDGIELLAASDSRIEGCTITNVGGHGIQAAKASSSAGIPNARPERNVVTGNFIDQSGLDGINVTSGNANEVLANTVLNSSNRLRDHDGIKIASDNAIECNENTVSGNTATDNQSKKTQRYGLAIVSAYCRGNVVAGNNFAGNRVGDILDYGTGTVYGSSTPDTEAPVAPTGLTANAASATQVDLAWTAAADNVAVTGYTVYRNGAAIATIGPATPAYQDTGASPSTTYSYTVDAFDGAGNRSPQSAATTVTTPAAPPGPALSTFIPSDDAQVSASSPSKNYGASTTLRVDASPVLRSYLKFNVSGITAPIVRATLRLYANNASSVGYDAHGAANTAWTEGTLTYANAPAFGAGVGSSGAFGSGIYTEVDVTPLITGSGAYTIVLTTSTSTTISLSSSENTFEPQLIVETSDAEPPPPDVEAPSAPTRLTATATGPTQVDLAWQAATDNVGVTGYTVYRDGAPLATTGPATTTFHDRSAAPETAYTYSVDAFDAAGNHSGRSAPASATTPALPPPPTSFTFAPDADANVNETSPTSNNGALTTLRVDGSPLVHSYLKFTVAGTSGRVTRAKLRLYATSSSNSGYDVHAASDTSWTETGITFANAPAFGSIVGSSGPFAAGGYTEVDVTPMITGAGTYTLVLTTTNATGLSLASRESANDPQLVVETSNEDPPPPDAEPPTTPTGLSATPLAATLVELAWSASTDNVAVAGYTVYREGAIIGTVGGGTTRFQDSTAAPSSTYSYAVDAFDAANNHSAASAPATATTPAPPPPPTVFTLVATDDAQVDESLPNNNYGAHSTLRLDASPVIHAYLKFTLTGASGTVSRATLRLYANSSSNTGFEARGSSDTSWTESTITYANAPAFGTVVSSTGPYASGAYVELDVTPLISGNGTYTIVLTAPGTTGLSLGSSESANAPELIVETTG